MSCPRDPRFASATCPFWNEPRRYSRRSFGGRTGLTRWRRPFGRRQMPGLRPQLPPQSKQSSLSLTRAMLAYGLLSRQRCLPLLVHSGLENLVVVIHLILITLRIDERVLGRADQ